MLSIAGPWTRGLRPSRRSPCRRVHTRLQGLNAGERDGRGTRAVRWPFTAGRVVRTDRAESCVASSGHLRRDGDTTDRSDGSAAPRADWRVCSVSRPDPRRHPVIRVHRHTRLLSGDWAVCDGRAVPGRRRRVARWTRDAAWEPRPSPRSRFSAVTVASTPVRCSQGSGTRPIGDGRGRRSRQPPTAVCGTARVSPVWSVSLSKPAARWSSRPITVTPCSPSRLSFRTPVSIVSHR